MLAQLKPEDHTEYQLEISVWFQCLWWNKIFQICCTDTAAEKVHPQCGRFSPADNRSVSRLVFFVWQKVKYGTILPVCSRVEALSNSQRSVFAERCDGTDIWTGEPKSQCLRCDYRQHARGIKMSAPLCPAIKSKNPQSSSFLAKQMLIVVLQWQWCLTYHC